MPGGRLSKLRTTPAAKPSGSDPNATKTAPDPAAAADQALTKAPSWSAEMVLGGLQVTGRRATRNGAGPFVRRARLGPFSRNRKLPFGRAACLGLDRSAWARHPGLPPLADAHDPHGPGPVAQQRISGARAQGRGARHLAYAGKQRFRKSMPADSMRLAISRSNVALLQSWQNFRYVFRICESQPP